MKIKTSLTPEERKRFDELQVQKNIALDKNDLKAAKRIQKEILQVIAQPT